MNHGDKLQDLCRTSQRAWSKADRVAIPPRTSELPTRPGMTSVQLAALSRQLAVPVEIAAHPQVLGRAELAIVFGPGRSIEPISVRVPPGVGFEDLRGYSAVTFRAADYNHTLADLRILRRLLSTLRPRTAPVEPGSDLWCVYHELVRLDRTIQRRQTERMGDGRISLEAFFSEVQFWRDFHAELAAVIAREVDEDRARVSLQTLCRDESPFIGIRIAGRAFT